MPRVIGEVHDIDQFVGQRLRAIRVKAGKSQKQIAMAIGISFQQFQKYENAKNRISASMLYETAQILGVSAADFFPPFESEGKRSRSPALLSPSTQRIAENIDKLTPPQREAVRLIVRALAEK